MQASISREELVRVLERYAPTQERMATVAAFLHGQIKDRFATAGASSGQSWEPRRLEEWGAELDHDVLGGIEGELFQSFEESSDSDSATVSSGKAFSYVHQLGTSGKGGELPPIRPRHAKALFIPITARAKQAHALFTETSPRIVRDGNKWSILKSKRLDPTQQSVGPGLPTMSSLVKGRVKNGKLQRLEDGHYVDGIPDFIFLQVVNIPPRTMIPDAPVERTDQLSTVAKILTS